MVYVYLGATYIWLGDLVQVTTLGLNFSSEKWGLS